MTFTQILKEVVWLLLTEGRISYFRIRRDFSLDDEGLAELRHELIFAKRCARDEDGRFLVWTAAIDVLPALPLRASLPGAPAAGRADVERNPVRTARDVEPGERRQLTVMFCDLVGSTDLSTRLDPEDLADVIRTYQDEAARIIRGFEGFIAKFMGDGILVYFGYPHAQEKEAERAVRSAIAIVEAMPSLNERLGRSKLDLAVRIGLATGVVMVGESVGEGAAAEKAVVGETPNLAARLQGLAQPNGIVVSAVTRELAGDGFAFEDLGPHVLKGIAEPVQVWGVMGLREAPDEQESHDEVLSRPLVGRDEELGLLRRAWQQARDERRGQVVLISGEPGIGKTTLIGVLRADVLAKGLQRMTMRCSPYHANSALYPVIEHLKRAAGWRPEDDAAVRLDKLERLLAGYSFPLAESLPRVANLLSVPVPTDRYAPLDVPPQILKQQTEDVLNGMILEEAERQPLLQLWEDLHWADPSTLELLGSLIDQAPTTRLLMVLTFRPEFTPPWPMRSHLTPITLHRLERPEIEALATQVAGGKALPEEVMEHIVRKTDGVPLYVEEMTKTVLGSSVLQEETDRYVLTGPLSSLAIPASLQDVLMARLDRLPRLREVAQLGAVLGREFAYDMVHAIATLDEFRLRDGLGQLVGAELLYQRGRPPRATYVFKHALIQDAAYQSLLKRTRQQYHRQVAELLEQRFPETAEAQPELLAHHYGVAGQNPEALSYWHKAGQRAVQRSANKEAANHLGNALALLETLPDDPDLASTELSIQRLLGTALMSTKGYAAPETGATFARALELCRTVDRAVDVFPVLAGVYLFEFTKGNHATAKKLAEEIFEKARSAPEPVPIIVGHVSVGASDLHLGQPALADKRFEDAVRLYEAEMPVGLGFQFGLDFGVAGCAYRALTLWLLGHPGEAQQWGERTLALIDAANHPFTKVRGRFFNLLLHQFRGDWSTVHREAETIIETGTEHGFAMVVAVTRIIDGAARAALGDSDGGIRGMRAALEQYSSTGARVQRTLFLTLLADALRAQGAIEDGVAVLAEAADQVEETGERFYEAEVHRVRGALLKAGNGKEAAIAAAYRKALEVARRQKAKPFELRAAHDLAALWAGNGKRRQAFALLSPLCDDIPGIASPDLAEARTLLDAVR